MKKATKIDWNDCHNKGLITQTKMQQYLHYGALVIAPTDLDKALEIYHHRGYKSFHFDFKDQLYWFNLDLDKYMKSVQKLSDDNESIFEELSDSKKRELQREALKQCGGITNIANFQPDYSIFFNVIMIPMRLYIIAK